MIEWPCQLVTFKDKAKLYSKQTIGWRLEKLAKAGEKLIFASLNYNRLQTNE